MIKRRLLAIPALTILAACTSLTAQVRGRVVDDQDRPVAGAQVSLGSFPSLPEEGEPQVLESDANGEFDGAVSFRSRSGAYVRALDPDLGRGGIAYFNRRREPVTIVVRPLTRVRGRVSYDGLPRPIRELNAPEGFRGRYLQVTRLGPSRINSKGLPVPTLEHVAYRMLDDGRFEFLLPAGTYMARAYGLHEPLTREFTVAEGGSEIDLGALEARPLPGHEIYGAPAPELHFADTRGLPNDFTLSSLRGKWVVLYFWDHRMRANSHWLPSLVRFYEERKDFRDRFEIIGVHNCDDVVTVAELDRARAWDEDDHKLEPLPFPVGIDDDEESFNAYFIARGRRRQSPSWFVVNPEGNVEFCPTVVNVADFLKSKLEAK